MAEAHFVGQLVGAEGFNNQNVFCKWGIEVGRGWRLLEGFDDGRTQTDHPQDDEMAVWAHPLDLHYATATVAGWPKLHFQVWSEDTFGRKELSGYGFTFLPTVVGQHKLECVTWKPAASRTFDSLRMFFLGGGPQLSQNELVYSQDDRFRLCTETAGVVHIDVGVILKDFEDNGVETSALVNGIGYGNQTTAEEGDFF